MCLCLLLLLRGLRVRAQAKLQQLLDDPGTRGRTPLWISCYCNKEEATAICAREVRTQADHLYVPTESTSTARTLPLWRRRGGACHCLDFFAEHSHVGAHGDTHVCTQAQAYAHKGSGHMLVHACIQADTQTDRRINIRTDCQTGTHTFMKYMHARFLHSQGRPRGPPHPCSS